jgi:orotate phosphoribosyltransferase
VRELGGVPVGAACLVDRSNGTTELGMPLTALLTVDFPTFAPEDVPPALAAIPPIKPGSRGLR